MTAKYNLLPKTTFSGVSPLDTVLCLLLTHGKITRTQYIELHKLAAISYPATLEIDQRMAKGVLYVCVNGTNYQINNRAKIKLIGENT